MRTACPYEPPLRAAPAEPPQRAVPGPTLRAAPASDACAQCRRTGRWLGFGRLAKLDRSISTRPREATRSTSSTRRRKESRASPLGSAHPEGGSCSKAHRLVADVRTPDLVRRRDHSPEQLLGGRRRPKAWPGSIRVVACHGHRVPGDGAHIPPGLRGPVGQVARASRASARPSPERLPTWAR